MVLRGVGNWGLGVVDAGMGDDTVMLPRSLARAALWALVWWLGDHVDPTMPISDGAYEALEAMGLDWPETDAAIDRQRALLRQAQAALADMGDEPRA
jgi:hypothetical protein